MFTIATSILHLTRLIEPLGGALPAMHSSVSIMPNSVPACTFPDPCPYNKQEPASGIIPPTRASEGLGLASRRD